MNKELTESLEKYLLAIYELSQENQDIKVKDVSNYLKIGGSTTSEAVKTLTKKGFVDYQPYGTITLTRKGEDAVELKIYRHDTISKFLNNVLEIDKESAEKNATKIEYSMTEEVLVKFVHFLDFMESCTCKEPKWVKSCKTTLQNGKMTDKCQNCISENHSGCGNCCGGCH